MAVLLNVPSQQYTPRIVEVNPTFPAGASRVRVTLTGPSANWPAGIDYLDPDSGAVQPNAVFRLAIIRPDGSAGGAAVFGGGLLLNRAGQPNFLRWFEGALQASQGPLAAAWGPYTVTAEVLVTFTAAILIERF